MAGQATLHCVGLGMVLLLSACATTFAPKKPTVESKPVVEFPSQATLAAIAARPAPAPGAPQGEVRSRDWTVDGTPVSGVVCRPLAACQRMGQRVCGGCCQIRT